MHTQMPEADSLFDNNYLTGCIAKEIRIRGIGREMGKEGEQMQSDASPSWWQFNIKTQLVPVTLGGVSKETA